MGVSIREQEALRRDEGVEDLFGDYTLVRPGANVSWCSYRDVDL
ncbi:MAG: hypothetical protein QXL29_08255 [Zestosphaera sp.]